MSIVLQSTLIETVNRIAPRARDNYLESIRRGGPLFGGMRLKVPIRISDGKQTICLTPFGC
jgi:hypothetical protein